LMRFKGGAFEDKSRPNIEMWFPMKK